MPMPMLTANARVVFQLHEKSCSLPPFFLSVSLFLNEWSYEQDYLWDIHSTLVIGLLDIYIHVIHYMYNTVQ